ncbi:MAG: hypothetical protein JNK26_03840 [Candidatus Doudnabacteria bacterium]|nr:hypothetical protein [Candidatus Doudnabacteria bacterium]
MALQPGNQREAEFFMIAAESGDDAALAVEILRHLNASGVGEWQSILSNPIYTEAISRNVGGLITTILRLLERELKSKKVDISFSIYRIPIATLTLNDNENTVFKIKEGLMSHVESDPDSPVTLAKEEKTVVGINETYKSAMEMMIQQMFVYLHMLRGKYPQLTLDLEVRVGAGEV